MNLTVLLALASLAFLAVLIAVHVRGGARPQRRIFALAALVLAAAHASILLLLLAREPERALAHARTTLALFVFFPALGIPFFAAFGRENEREVIVRRTPWIAALALVPAAAAAFLPARFFAASIHFTPDGAFWGLTFTAAGKAAAVYLILVNVLFLHLFENTYRAATVADKVTLKYPFLGILTASIVNIAVMSRVLAIATIDRDALAVQACGVVALCVSFLYASLRYPLFDLRIAAPRGRQPSIVSVTVSALYLLSLGIITLLARILGLPYDRFLSTVLGIFGVFLLLALLISGKAKRRLRTFLGENFYLQRYNYRKEWRRYAEIMESGSTTEEFLSNVASSLCDTMVVRRGVFWTNIGAGKAGYYGFPREEVDRELVEELLRLTADEPVLILKRPLERPAGGTGGDAAGADDWSWVRAAARLGQGAETRGLIALGEMDLGRSYTEEDEDFLSLVAYRAKLALDNMLMEERIIESRQMESFNRFASFVVHDLKNTVGMLSLMAENARVNIGSPEFQHDALETIQRSVEKMQHLINSLNVRKLPATISKAEIDLSSLIERAAASVEPLAGQKGLRVEKEAVAGIRARIDATAMNRVIENLALNAVEATPPGGAVRVAVERAEDVWARVTVRDTGPGFDPDYLREHLFHPFHSTKKQGLGVGLVLCKSLVEAHGGRISIESAPGAGATVTVMLPALPAAGS